MYVKCDGQLKAIKTIVLTSDSKTIQQHIKTETGTADVNNCPSESLNHYHLRKLLSPKINIPSDTVCENEDFIN